MILARVPPPELSCDLGPVPIPPGLRGQVASLPGRCTPERQRDNVFGDVAPRLFAPFRQAVSCAADATIQANSLWKMSLCAPEGGSPFLTTSEESMLRIAPLAKG
jgi:hypothetical protein